VHNEELHNLYYSPSIIRMMKSRRMRWVENLASMGKKSACRVLLGKPEGGRLQGRLRCRWEDNIKMALTKIGWGRVWTGFIWLRIGTSGRLL
jgi:hypothetical protein